MCGCWNLDISESRSEILWKFWNVLLGKVGYGYFYWLCEEASITWNRGSMDTSCLITGVLKYVTEGRQKRREDDVWDSSGCCVTLGKEKILKAERRSNRSHLLLHLLSKRLCTFCKTDYVMNFCIGSRLLRYTPCQFSATKCFDAALCQSPTVPLN